MAMFAQLQLQLQLSCWLSTCSHACSAPIDRIKTRDVQLLPKLELLVLLIVGFASDVVVAGVRAVVAYRCAHDAAHVSASPIGTPRSGDDLCGWGQLC